MHNMETRLTRRYQTYGIMVVMENDGGTSVWEVYYKLTHYPWTFAFGLPVKPYRPEDVFDIAESNFDIFSDGLFNDEED